jgi:antirestriction protein ArdC
VQRPARLFHLEISMKDFYQDVTNRIVAAIEAGTLPRVRPWSVSDHRPRNAATKRPYRGMNSILLGLEAQLRGYANNAWLTYKQAAALNGQVRGGETGTAIVLYKLHEIDAKNDETKRVVPLMRSFTVFNVAQIDGLPQPTPTARPALAWDPHVEAELLLASSGADIRVSNAFAYYHPSKDAMYLPAKESFTDQGAYYATALHELTHWTGHKSRCSRDLSGRFGNDAYAVEELIAEMGSAFLCAHCRLDGRLQHAAYLHSWLQVLKADKRAIFTASAKAQQAADYLLGSVETEQSDEEIAA